MQAFVHFAVGVSFGMVALLFVDWEGHREFLLVFASGFWALIPDGHMLFRQLGVAQVARPWQAVHRSALADLFWFHGVLDDSETGLNHLELGVALAVLFVALVGFYRFNRWTGPL